MPRTKLFNLIFYGFILCAGLVALKVVYALFSNPQLYWDLDVYTGATEALAQNRNPYTEIYNGLMYVYPPLSLKLFALAGPWLEEILFGFFVTVTLAFFWKAPANLRLAGIFVFIVATDSVYYAVSTGNVTLFLHILILTLWVLRVRQGVLLAVILAAGLIKPVLAVYFALWLLSCPLTEWKQISKAVAAGLLCVALTLGQMLVFPAEFASFIEALSQQIHVNADRPDFGHNAYAVFFLMTGSPLPALAAHFALWVASAALWIWIRPRLGSSPMRETLIMAVPVLLCLLLTPRLKIYDLVAFYLIVAWLVLHYSRVSNSFLWLFIYPLATGVARYLAGHSSGEIFNSLVLATFLASLGTVSVLIAINTKPGRQ